MRFAFPMLLLVAAGVAVSPARAGLYKWVDDKGVTHYSDQAPATKTASEVPERISVYKPDPALLRAMSAPRPDARLANRVAVLERQLQQERSYRDEATSYAAAAQKAAFDQCVAERRVDCDQPGYYSGYSPSLVVVGRSRPLPPIRALRPITGITAGNVVGVGGIMPGEFNGPNAITAGNVVTFNPSAALVQGRRWH